jgi:hypothetical protein
VEDCDGKHEVFGCTGFDAFTFRKQLDQRKGVPGIAVKVVKE